MLRITLRVRLAANVAAPEDEEMLRISIAGSLARTRGPEVRR